MDLNLILQGLPLLLLLSLLLSGRAGPQAAILAALAAAVPAVWVSLPAGSDLAAFLVAETLRGSFIAVKPLGVVIGGLLFHAAVAGAAAPAATTVPDPRRVFVVTILMGAFMESVTGFGVGAIFALGRLRAMGLRGAPAGALSLLALCMVPWGGLGPGILLGAALIAAPAQEIAQVAAYPNAAWLLMLGPISWRLCTDAGLIVPVRERAVQMVFLTAMATHLVLGHTYLPFEVVGVFTAGLQLLWGLWRLNPPHDVPAWGRAVRAIAPYLTLTTLILVARSVPNPPMIQPWSDLPGLPITHVSVVLALMGTGLLAMQTRPWPVAVAALRRGVKVGGVLVMYVLLAQWLAASGATVALARAATVVLGSLAPFAVAPLGVLAGMVTGSSTGANASFAMVQYQFGVAGDMPPLLAPGVHNFACGAGAGMSFIITAVICGLLADGTRPAQIWRLLLPSLIAVVVIGWAFVIVLR